MFGIGYALLKLVRVMIVLLRTPQDVGWKSGVLRMMRFVFPNSTYLVVDAVSHHRSCALCNVAPINHGPLHMQRPVSVPTSVLSKYGCGRRVQRSGGVALDSPANPTQAGRRVVATCASQSLRKWTRSVNRRIFTERGKGDEPRVARLF